MRLPEGFWTAEPAGKARQQADRLPAYDDMGNPIARADIEARMRSGKGGGLVGGVLGGVLGLLLGAVAAPGCAFEILGPSCSPREDALAGVAVLSGLAWGVTLGVIAGREIRDVDRWEALARIRAERRAHSDRRQ